jgi:hypothetical protein
MLNFLYVAQMGGFSLRLKHAPESQLVISPLPYILAE